MRRPPDVLIRVTFELHFRGKHLVTDIQDRISAFSAQPFPALLEDNLAAFGKDRLLVFEHVELEIGEVRLSRLEEDLAAGIARCLRRWAFSARPSSSWPRLPASQDATVGEREDAQLLVGGRWHWPRMQPSSIAPGLNAAIAAALAKPGEWPEFLSVLRENYALRRRIADEVSPKLLRRLLAALVQDHGPFIADWAETMIRLHERQPLIPVNIHVFRRALWESVFAELAALSGNQLAQRSFIVKVLRRLTGVHFSTDLVAANLSKALKHQPAKTTIGTLLAEATSELQADKARLATNPSIVVNSKSENASRHTQDLQTFLESGVLGWSLTGRDVEAEMLELLAVAPGDVCVLFQDATETESVRKRLATQFSERAKSRLLMLLAPIAGSWMVCFMQQLRRIHGQKQLFPFPNRQFANDLWELCFEYLAQRKGKSFDPQSFLRHLLGQIAVRRKTNYELLLSDLLLRRGPDLRVRSAAGLEHTSLGKALVGLLDQTLFGFDELAGGIPRSLINPRFRSLYSDLDVLTHWLRWHKLPDWSHADDPEVTGRRLGSLLSRLPQGIQTYAARGSDRDRTPPAQAGRSDFSFTLSEQIRHWLAFGLWPDSVMAPEASHLSAWLENQSDADWLKALEGDGAHEAMVARLSRQASSSLFERITRLLAGRAAGLVSGYLRCLDNAGRRIAPVATQLWADQLKKYTLMYLLRASSISGRHAISVVELARSTMLALSLNCRVSYDRLLGGIEQQGRGQEELENICRVLRQELETDRATPDGDEPIPSSDRARVQQIPVILPEPRRPGAEIPKPAKASLPGTEVVHAVSTNSPSANIAAFAEFLRTGLFPSSADALALEPSRQSIAPYLSGNSQLLLEELQSIAVHPGAVSRLIRYVSPKQLQQIAQAAAPNYAGLLLLYISAGSRLGGASAAAVVPHSESRCAAIHWQQTLAVVLDRHSPKHSAAVILREVTVRVSRQLAMNHAQYLSRLLSIARENKTESSGYAALADMLEQMLPDSAPAATPAATPPPGETESATAPSSGEKGGRSRTLEPATGASSTDVEDKGNEIVANSDDAAVSGVHDDRKSDDDLTIEVPAPNDALAQLDYLLRYGELAENAPQGSSEELMAMVANQLSARAIVYRRYLLKCAGNELERRRMARLFPSHLLDRVWPILTPAHYANIAFYKEVLEQALAQSDAGSSTICREIVVEELLKAISNSQACRWDAAACLKAAVERLAHRLSIAPYNFVRRVRAVLENKPVNTCGEMTALVERIELEFAKTPPLRPAQTSQSDRTKPKPQQPARPSPSVPEGEPFYIANAGLVLLWPFLQTYFQRLGLLEKNTFRDGLSQIRAIYLLQYLTAAQLEAPEHELLLNKILSGWTIEQPLEPPSALTESEEALSTQLLQGVLKNWEKLKSTSIQGLRSSFLMREGKLLLKDETWSLTVSNKAYDVLLDSLPWSLKMIRLPWMKTLLQVKWR